MNWFYKSNDMQTRLKNHWKFLFRKFKIKEINRKPVAHSVKNEISRINFAKQIDNGILI